MTQVFRGQNQQGTGWATVEVGAGGRKDLPEDTVVPLPRWRPRLLESCLEGAQRFPWGRWVFAVLPTVAWLRGGGHLCSDRKLC